ncbi:hypothetical protein AVEN_169593-1 [Araneus ventricosus]|uniref:Uncharacterized protein n=1 Tax=Araneus ventricosus TaxID=182803 RepID=A0A4Y2QSL0_ARAVE|nr:hypothetical protein AVEN_169593-1 [Araneus ventricosus]
MVSPSRSRKQDSWRSTTYEEAPQSSGGTEESKRQMCSSIYGYIWIRNSTGVTILTNREQKLVNNRGILLKSLGSHGVSLTNLESNFTECLIKLKLNSFHIQRLSLLNITGAYKTTPTAALQVISGIMPLPLKLEAEANFISVMRLKHNIIVDGEEHKAEEYEDKASVRGIKHILSNIICTSSHQSTPSKTPKYHLFASHLHLHPLLTAAFKPAFEKQLFWHKNPPENSSRLALRRSSPHFSPISSSALLHIPCSLLPCLEQARLH